MIPPFSRRKVGFGLKTLVKDSNVAQIQDPSAIWGAADFLPRRNLLTYTEDFSNAAWTKTDITVTSDNTTAPDGTVTADLMTVAASGGPLVSRSTTLVSNTAVIFSIYLKPAASIQWVRVLVSDGGATNRITAWFDIVNGVVGTVTADAGGSGISASIASSANGFYRLSLQGSIAAANYIAYVRPVVADNSTTAQYSCTYWLWGAQLQYTTTTSREYQKITDWTTEQYAHAAQKNVPCLRRNLLQYTEGAFNNATYWVKSIGGTGVNPVVTDNYSAVAAPDGTYTASRVQLDIAAGSTSSDYSRIFQLVSSGLSNPHSGHEISIWARATSTDCSVQFADTVTGSTNASIVALSSTWQKITLPSSSVANVAATLNVRLLGNVTTSKSADLLVWHPLIAASPCDYQAVGATWAAEYTALALAAGYPISMYSDASGSVATYGPDDPVRVMLDQKQSGVDIGASISQMSGTGWTVSNGVATHTAGSGSSLQVSALEIGATYQMTCTVSGRTAGTVEFRAGLSTTSPAVSVNGVMTAIATCITDTYLRITPTGGTFDGSVSNLRVVKITNHATAPSDAARPTLRLDGNGKWYLERDLSDDNLPVTWATNLTSTGVIYTAAGDYTTKDSNLILSGATNYTTPKYDYGRVVLKAPSALDAKIIKYLDGKRGRTYQLGPELVTNGTFPTDTIGWVETTTGVMSWEAGRVKLTAGAAGNGARQQLALTIGKEYLVVGAVDPFSCTNMMVSILRNDLGARLFDSQTVTSGSPTVSFTFVATETNSHIYLRPGAAGIGYGDNISVREILL